MKKLSFLFCLLYYNFVFVQNDSIFPNLKGEWYMDYVMFDVFPFDHDYGTLQIKKLDENYDTMALYSYEYHIANFYTDSLKVYFKRITNGLMFGTYEYRPEIGYNYEVIYDFSLKENDTAYIDVKYLEPAIVLNIDTLIFNGQERRKYYLSNGDRWIQGIGSLKHPLYSKITYCFECEVEVCSVNLEYEGSSPLDSLNYMVNICPYASIEEKELDFVKIYPNPLLTNTLNLGFISEIEKTIKIFDLQGKELLKQHVSSKETSIDLAHLQAGFYFVELLQGKEKIVKSFVKE